jgi:hypothetical protein
LNARLVGASDGVRMQPDSSEYEELAI